LFFYDLNIIFNLSHPSNHSQTSTNFTLNSLTFTINPLKVNDEGETGEGRGKFLYFSIMSVIQ